MDNRIGRGRGFRPSEGSGSFYPALVDDQQSIDVAARRSSARETECDEQYERDIFHCNMIGSAACYQQAMLRYANFLAGLPIPPLSY
jgi:hypothetical protein